MPLHNFGVILHMVWRKKYVLSYLFICLYASSNMLLFVHNRHSEVEFNSINK
jgi:hypothetical protein